MSLLRYARDVENGKAATVPLEGGGHLLVHEMDRARFWDRYFQLLPPEPEELGEDAKATRERLTRRIYAQVVAEQLVAGWEDEDVGEYTPEKAVALFTHPDFRRLVDLVSTASTVALSYQMSGEEAKKRYAPLMSPPS